jgi:hypothetical protein
MPISDNAMSVLNGGGEQQPAQPKQQGGAIQASLTDWLRHSHMIAALAPQQIRSVMSQAQLSFGGMITGAMNKKADGSGMKARKMWEQATREALRDNALRLQTYGAIWSNPKAPIDQKMAEIQQAASEWGDQTISNMAMDPQQFTTFGQIYDQMTKQQAEAEKATATLDGQIKQIEARMPKQPQSGVVQPGLSNEGFDEAGGPHDPASSQGGVPPIKPYMQ